MRFACLLVEHLPTRVESLLDSSLSAKPIVIVRAWDDQVLDASPEVMVCGIRLHDSQRRVEQLCPQAIVLPAREPLYQAQHDQLRSSLLNFANAVETAELGELFADIGALARTFPSEAVLAQAVLQSVEQATHLPATLGFAANKFTAAMAAQQAERIATVPEGQERHFLESLPLKVLPDLPPEMLRRLHLFGITTLGGFAQLPHPAAVLQFGSELAFYHDLARGIDPRPLVPQSPPPAVSRTLNLPEAIEDRSMLLAAVERLAARLAHRLVESGHHALALALTVTTQDGHEQSTGAPVKPPSADTEQLRRLAGRLLGKLAFNAAVISLTLTAYPLREWHQGARQLTLLDAPAQSKLARLRVALQLLQRRFGEAIVKLASTLGPPLPLSIEVKARPDGVPLWLGWGGWSCRVAHLYEYWREQWAWWDRPTLRDYYQIEADDGTVFTLFRDDQQHWFLDRRRGG